MPRCSTHLLPCSCAAALPLEPGQLLNHLPLAAWSRRWCAIGSHPWCASPRSPLADRRSEACMMPTLCCCMPACWACCAAVDCFLPARPPPARRPQIGAIFSGGDFSQLTFSVNGSTFFYGDFINVLIYFIIVCLVVYFGVGGARRRSACSYSARHPPLTHTHTHRHTHTHLGPNSCPSLSFCLALVHNTPSLAGMHLPCSGAHERAHSQDEPRLLHQEAPRRLQRKRS